MNQTVSVVARITSSNEHLETVTHALRQAVAATLQEEGCEHYELFQTQGKPNELFIIERWRNEQALTAHIAAPAFIALSRALDGKAELEVTKLNSLPA